MASIEAVLGLPFDDPSTVDEQIESGLVVRTRHLSRHRSILMLFHSEETDSQSRKVAGATEIYDSTQPRVISEMSYDSTEILNVYTHFDHRRQGYAIYLWDWAHSLYQSGKVPFYPIHSDNLSMNGRDWADAVGGEHRKTRFNKYREPSFSL